MNVKKIARQTVEQALNSTFYTQMSRFDVTSPKCPDFRVYGRVTQVYGHSNRVVMIQNIKFPQAMQGKGLFNALCAEFRKHPETKGLRIYIQCVQNPTWKQYLSNSPKWVEQIPGDFLSVE